MIEYTHLPEDEDIGPEGRSYRIKEEVLDYKGKKVLCLESEAKGGITCCDGSYAQEISSLFVKGYIIEWKSMNEEGKFISKLEAIKEPTEQQEIAEIIRDKFQESNIYF
jgi:hypothetical protein